MLIFTMVPTDSITIGTANLVLDSINYTGNGKCMMFKLSHNNGEKVIPLYDNQETVLNIDNNEVLVHTSKIRPTCGKLYFHDTAQRVFLHYNKGNRGI